MSNTSIDLELLHRWIMSAEKIKKHYQGSSLFRKPLHIYDTLDTPAKKFEFGEIGSRNFLKVKE